ncbi:hypothetical protein [Kingella sp. (in: b-proteobacteria)]|uniref:hypothetical protein n=1 Tax=Kingella sp. (in: b-proteobacteria) TaxID=2020713 RepID=UPI0026DB909F|nr:hypothetical protein [Kingella sp. (in: b-proteobacteria)]MDO4656646.1 hypothetical protein [Kingella sp. (in: b-proteobacteria)]
MERRRLVATRTLQSFQPNKRTDKLSALFCLPPRMNKTPAIHTKGSLKTSKASFNEAKTIFQNTFSGCLTIKPKRLYSKSLHNLKGSLKNKKCRYSRVGGNLV